MIAAAVCDVSSMDVSICVQASALQELLCMLSTGPSTTCTHTLGLGIARDDTIHFAILGWRYNTYCDSCDSFCVVICIVIIGCALLAKERQALLSHIYLIIIFAHLKLGQYLDYIKNVDVKSVVLVSIELLVSECTFRCTV